MNLDANDWKSIVEATPPEAQPVLLYNMEWVSDYEPDGIVQGFWEESTKVYIGAFWNNYQDTWGAVECKPTHWMYLPPAPILIDTMNHAAREHG